MKNQHIFRRMMFALAGLRASIRTERSFRAHLIVFALVVIMLLVLKPAPLWWALLLAASGLMMVVELINTSVEKLIDHVHPDQHAIIGVVKDTLAAAVLVSCCIGGVCLLAFLWQYFAV